MMSVLGRLRSAVQLASTSFLLKPNTAISDMGTVTVARADSFDLSAVNAMVEPRRAVFRIIKVRCKELLGERFALIAPHFADHRLAPGKYGGIACVLQAGAGCVHAAKINGAADEANQGHHGSRCQCERVARHVALQSRQERSCLARPFRYWPLLPLLYPEMEESLILGIGFDALGIRLAQGFRLMADYLFSADSCKMLSHSANHSPCALPQNQTVVLK
jgi:hypothetical protein